MKQFTLNIVRIKFVKNSFGMMKGFHCAALVLISLVSFVSSSSDTCSYSVQRSCVAPGAQDVRSNILSSINTIKLAELSKKKNELGLKAYGGSKDDDNYTKALCPCACDRCPKPMKAQSESSYGETNDEVDSNKCLCLCGTCGKKNSNKNKLPAIVPLDCNLKCEVIANTKPSSGGYKPSQPPTQPPSSYQPTTSSSYVTPPTATASASISEASSAAPVSSASSEPSDEDEDDDLEGGNDELDEEDDDKK